MNLLLSRGQILAGFSFVPLRVGLGAIFSLKAELELDEEEQGLITSYRLTNVALVVSDAADDLRRAVRPAMLLSLLCFVTIVTFGLVARTPPLTIFMLGIPLSLLLLAVLINVYFTALRELILVSDLLGGGRTFYCDSVVDLIKKEAFLESISEYLRQVLESAKHWQDREVITIKPLDKAAAKQAVLRGA